MTGVRYSVAFAVLLVIYCNRLTASGLCIMRALFGIFAKLASGLRRHALVTLVLKL